jgi:hypothetical protein
MQSPPATMAWTRVSSLRPGWAATGPQIERWSVACSIPSRSASVAGSSNPALATAPWSVEGDIDLVNTTCEDGIEKVSSDSRPYSSSRCDRAALIGRSRLSVWAPRSPH